LVWVIIFKRHGIEVLVLQYAFLFFDTAGLFYFSEHCIFVDGGLDLWLVSETGACFFSFRAYEVPLKEFSLLMLQKKRSEGDVVDSCTLPHLLTKGIIRIFSDIYFWLIYFTK
jgi:hypothetical protein